MTESLGPDVAVAQGDIIKKSSVQAVDDEYTLKITAARKAGSIAINGARLGNWPLTTSATKQQNVPIRQPLQISSNC